MKADRRGPSLIELIFAAGLGLAVLAVGYRMYFSVTRINDYENKRESMTLSVQNVMGRIKQDVRAARSVSGSGNSLALTSDAGQIVYRNARNGSGLQRSMGGGWCVFRGVTARFSPSPRGAEVSLRSQSSMHRRPIRIEISSFVSPRNR